MILMVYRMSKPIILVDCDDVLGDLVSYWIDRYNQDYDDRLTRHHITSWDVSAYVNCGKRIYEYLYEPGFFRDIPIVSGAQEVLARLSNIYRLVAVTSTPYCAVHDRAFWLRKHFPMIKELVIAKNKHCVAGNFFIDDAPHNLEGHSAVKILFDRPHNQEYHNAYRAKDWYDVEWFIYDYERQNTI